MFQTEAEKQAAAESKLLDAAQKLLACRTLGIRHHADLDADLELAARELIAVIDAAHNALHKWSERRENG